MFASVDLAATLRSVFCQLLPCTLGRGLKSLTALAALMNPWTMLARVLIQLLRTRPMTGHIVCIQNALGNDAPNACPAAPLRFATITLAGQTLTRTPRGNVCICGSRCNVEKCVLPTAPLHFGSMTEIVDRTGCTYETLDNAGPCAHPTAAEH